MAQDSESHQPNNDIHHNTSSDEIIHHDVELHGEHDVHADEHHEAHAEHEHTLYAENLGYIGNMPVTNSLLTSWVAVFLIILLAVAIRRKTKKVPGVFQSIMEKVVEGALGMMDMVTNDRKKSKKIFPIIFSIFIFILINNWLGLIPGIGSITYNGVALLRGGTADLNTTLALGLFGVVAANVFGVIVVGGWKYFNKFVNVKTLIDIPVKVRKEPTVVLINPINFLIAWGVPLPFMFLEIIVGMIQALIFAVLTLVYFTIASTEHDH